MKKFKHIPDPVSLVTSYEATRAGFISLALERSRRATPHVEEARALHTYLIDIKEPNALLSDVEKYPIFLAASGVSGKAATHLTTEDIYQAIKGLVDNYLNPAGESFRDELVYRFLLTKGDTLGGSMRNVGGALAQRKFVRAVLSQLLLFNIKYSWLHSDSNIWINQTDNDAGIEIYTKGLSWNFRGKSKTMIFNVSIKFVGKSGNNIDVVIFEAEPSALKKFDHCDPKLYLALGELKGGIDPAGADEHWKTASKALTRIRSAFIDKKLNPNIFFVAGAIQPSMANEIWDELTEGVLSNAANLTKPDQLASIAEWIVKL